VIKKYDSHIIAAIGTILLVVLLFLLLYFLRIQNVAPVEEDEIEVTFDYGEDFEDLAEIDVKEQEFQSVPQVVNKQAQHVDAPSVNKNMIVQNDTKSLHQPKPVDTLDLKTKKEEINQKKVDNANNLINGLFNSQTNSEVNEPIPNSGSENPIKKGPGKGGKGGVSWSLDGRDNIELPQPEKKFTETCTVHIDVLVDELGNVRSATISGKTITSDQGALEAAKKAALKAKFTPGDKMVKGTITYNFVLN
jgi:TonB family protein